MSITTLPIWKERGISFGAKMTFVAFHAGIPVSEDAWRDFLAKMGQPYVSRENCLYELRAAGLIG